MAARLSRLIAAAALLGAWGRPAAAQDAGDPVDGRQVITADAIRRAGIVRTGDLPTLFDRWDLATIDGITWQASPNGLAPLEAGRWMVLVDGQPVELGLFGTLNLNRLAVPLGAIDSIEVIDAPTVRGGELMAGGVVHLHTARPARGAAVAGWLTTGSEIGDPGPFAFTPRATPNVDRLGHESAVRATFGAERWWAEASVNALEHSPTDPALLRRYGAAAIDDARIEGSAPAARVGVRLFGGTHELAYRGSYLADFFSLAPLPGPLATSEHLAQIGVTGAVPLRGVGDLRYFAARTVNRSDARRAVPTPFRWRAVTWMAGADAVRGLHGALGARVRHVAATAGELTTTTVYAAARPTLARWLRPTMLAAVTLGDDDVGVAAAVSDRWAVARRYEVRASVSYARRTPAEDHSLWAWTDRGFSYLRDAGVEVTIDGLVRSRNEVTADVAVAAMLGAAARAHVATHWRSFDGVSLVSQELHYVSATESFEGPARVTTRASGQIAGLEAGIGTSPRGQLRGDVRYRLRGAVAGGARFRDAWAATPRHAARGTMTYLPVPGFDLQLAATYRSRTRWADYRLVEAESAGRYLAAVPASLMWSATAQKALWDGRLRMLVGVHNVTDSPVRFHPAGATWSPALVFQGEAALP